MDVATGKFYTGSVYNEESIATINNLPKGNLRIYVTDRRRSGKPVNVKFHVESANLHSK